MSKFILALVFIAGLNYTCFAQTQELKAGISDKPLQLLSIPRANYTEEARRRKAHGTVYVRITFLASGEIGDITVTKSKKKLQKTGLVNQAIEAAKKIKFIPAERAGKPISVVKTVEYNFNLY
ncbi:MAG: energy transducer TonB [Pyrinomonadaceae bacterium]